jgi:hemerythrin superfamily protein
MNRSWSVLSSSTLIKRTPTFVTTLARYRTQPGLRYSTATMTTISDRIIHDHRELEEYYNTIINATDTDTKTRYGNQFVWELARHSVGEELVVYPAFEHHLGAKGVEMAEDDRREHHQIKLLLKEFQKMSASYDDYIPKLKEIWQLLSTHIQGEERDDLPALEAALSSAVGKSESLAKSFDRTKWFVPTRSHPNAGEHPPFETVAGLLAAPIDHLADLFRKFPDKKAT